MFLMVVWGLNLPPHQGCSPISARDWIILLRKAWARYWLKAPSIFPHKLQLMPHVFFSPTGGITFLHKKWWTMIWLKTLLDLIGAPYPLKKTDWWHKGRKKKTWCVAEICQVSGRLPEAIASADQGCNLLDCWCLSSGSFKLTSPIIECGQGISSL
jgi:hypothetical protein